MRCEFELATSSALPSSLATKSNPTTATQSPGIVRGFLLLGKRCQFSTAGMHPAVRAWHHPDDER
jgi:hypothetical protein